jgi:DNA polymerase/3'-5' exonuclease PolX
MLTNKQIAEIFTKTADLLEIKGENPFKVKAYKNAARLIENISKDLNKFTLFFLFFRQFNLTVRFLHYAVYGMI